MERFGAIDVRAALRRARPDLARNFDHATARGYDPERICVSAASSAGGFGTLYNYHYVPDELQWRHRRGHILTYGARATTGARRARARRDRWLKAPRRCWAGALSQLPPYCLRDCGVGFAATAPRPFEVP